MKRHFTLNALSAVTLAAFSSTSIAAGFALQNQNGAGTGNAFAGAAAVAEDASTVFFNPAGMTALPEGNNLTVAGSYLDRTIEFENKGTSQMILPGPSVYPLGSSGGNAGGGSLVPVGYFTHSLSPSLVFGLGVSPTFGNKTEYTSDFVGRFSGYYTDLKIINLNPSIAFKANEKVTLGFGINRGSAEIEFRQRAPGIPAIPAPGEVDITLAGDGDAWGWNAGLMLQPDPSMRVGIAYRSKIKYDIEGSMINRLGATTLSTTPVKTELETPDSLSLAVSQKLDERWEMLGDLTWTGWSSVQSLDVVNANSGATVTSLSYRFKDTMRVGLGANYQTDSAWKLRFGVAWDESPVQSPADRTMTLPDSDRTWVAVGARYALSKASSIDVGYAHLFFDDASTERAVKASSGATIQTVRGNFDTSVDILSLQYNANF